MKITAVETVRCAAHPNLIWVRIETDEGLTGLGETFFGAGAVEAQIHDFAAPRLIGEDPGAVERHAERLAGYLGTSGSGVEMRAASALDLALWDLWGQASGQPVSALLGGPVRETVPVYNTCAGPDYVRAPEAMHPDRFAYSAEAAASAAKAGGGAHSRVHRYDDLDAFLTRADELAQDLLEMGIGGMKIWPFDAAANANRGLAISSAELARALAPFDKVREAVGDRIELKAEMHGLWRLPPALKIAEALEEFELSWIEDPVRMGHLGTLEAFTEACVTPVAAGETLGGLGAYRDLLERGAVDVPIIDLSWGGGLTVARKVAALADAWGLPVAAHDCSGPVVLAASVQFALATANVAEQEIARGFYYGWYADIVTAPPPLEAGRIRAPDGPGLGVALSPEFLARKDVTRRRTAAE